MPMHKPDADEVRRRFTFHAPNEERRALHEWVGSETMQMALEMRDMLPAGRNLSIVLTLLEDVRMRANMAIAVDGASEGG